MVLRKSTYILGPGASARLCTRLKSHATHDAFAAERTFCTFFEIPDLATLRCSCAMNLFNAENGVGVV
jgi:hypothetical protein